jgi:hypothetical protein
MSREVLLFLGFVLLTVAIVSSAVLLAPPTSPVVFRAPVSAPVSLRCRNGDPPTAWTRVEAEASMHRAQMALRSAERFGVWTSLGQRWATIATAAMLEILLCTQGAQP